MPPKSSRPPAKGSKAAADAKEAKDKKKAASSGDLIALNVFEGLTVKDEHADDGRVATGTLASELRARDVKIGTFSLALHGRPLVEV
jgi:hypothetical protein